MNKGHTQKDLHNKGITGHNAVPGADMVNSGLLRNDNKHSDSSGARCFLFCPVTAKSAPISNTI